MGGSAKANLRQTFTKFFIRSSERDHSRQTDYRANAQVGIDGGLLPNQNCSPQVLTSLMVQNHYFIFSHVQIIHNAFLWSCDF